MVITVNGKKEQINKGTTVRQILTDRNVRPEIVAVEINGEIIERDKYATTQLSSGDTMEFLHYMAGGAALAFSSVVKQSLKPLKIGFRMTFPNFRDIISYCRQLPAN